MITLQTIKRYGFVGITALALSAHSLFAANASVEHAKKYLGRDGNIIALKLLEAAAEANPEDPAIANLLKEAQVAQPQGGTYNARDKIWLLRGAMDAHTDNELGVAHTLLKELNSVDPENQSVQDLMASVEKQISSTTQKNAYKRPTMPTFGSAASTTPSAPTVPASTINIPQPPPLPNAPTPAPLSTRPTAADFPPPAPVPTAPKATSPSTAPSAKLNLKPLPKMSPIIKKVEPAPANITQPAPLPSLNIPTAATPAPVPTPPPAATPTPTPEKKVVAPVMPKPLVTIPTAPPASEEAEHKASGKLDLPDLPVEKTEDHHSVAEEPKKDALPKPEILAPKYDAPTATTPTAPATPVTVKPAPTPIVTIPSKPATMTKLPQPLPKPEAQREVVLPTLPKAPVKPQAPTKPPAPVPSETQPKASITFEKPKGPEGPVYTKPESKTPDLPKLNNTAGSVSAVSKPSTAAQPKATVPPMPSAPPAPKPKTASGVDLTNMPTTSHPMLRTLTTDEEL